MLKFKASLYFDT